jgi:hypothetical protein
VAGWNKTHASAALKPGRAVVVYLPVRAGRSAAASPRATAKAAPRRAAQQHTQRRASPAKATHKAAASKTSSKKRR